MDKKERASVVQEELMRLYENPPIPLTHHDPYTLLVAVLLSAQCTDKRVNLVTPALFALASTPEEMARQDVEAVREIVQPLRPFGEEGFRHREPEQDSGGAVRRAGPLRLPGAGITARRGS